MIDRFATVTEASTTRVGVTDRSASGLTVAHLRAFVEQADLAQLADSEKVRLRDELQSSSHWHTVEITAETREANTVEIVAPNDIAARYADGSHALVTDAAGDPACSCGFQPGPPMARTQLHAVSLIHQHAATEDETKE